MKTIILTILSLTTTVAMAEFEKHSPVQVDFNQMIESSAQETKELKKDLSAEGIGRQEETRIAKKKRVTDFLDVEVGWGEAPRVVDRRFNSIDEEPQAMDTQIATQIEVVLREVSNK